MARVSLPDRGQPLDIEYIYTLAEAINFLSTQITNSTQKTTRVKSTDGSGAHVIKTADAKIDAGFVPIVSGSVNAGASKTFTFSLSPGFKYSPVATAVVVNRGTSGVNTDATVVIDSVTTQSVAGTVYYHASGSFNLNVNIIAIGIPSNQT